MSRSDPRQRRLPIVFVALLLLNLGLMTINARRISPEDGTEQTVLRSWAIAALSPVQRILGSAVSSVTSVWSGYVDLRGSRERAEALEAENAELRSREEAATTAGTENERLREMLNLKGRTKYEWVAAEVIARDASTWFRRVTIDKGSNDGVALNQPVVTPGGLVGRVTAVGPNAAQVQLITDEHAGAGARLVSMGAAGEIKGRGDGMMRFKNISTIEQMDEKSHEAIATSGLDRIYPAGILVGKVSKVAPGIGASPYEITVEPAVQLDRLREVMVLKIKPKDLSTPEAIK